MASYQAFIMDAVTGGENRYPFDGPDDLMAQTPVRIVRHFMEIVDKTMLPNAHIDYELNAAMKNKERHVVTAMGSLMLENGGDFPFLLMIGKADG